MPNPSFASQTFEQSTPATTWNVQHNMNCDTVAIDVFVDYNGGVEKILPTSVVIVDSNNIQVIFSSPMSGEVRLF